MVRVPTVRSLNSETKMLDFKNPIDPEYKLTSESEPADYKLLDKFGHWIKTQTPEASEELDELLQVANTHELARGNIHKLIGRMIKG